MSNLALVTPEGLIVSDKKPSEVEKQQADHLPLHVVAAREAERVSTQKKVNE